MKDPLKLNDRVTHAANPTKNGIVTAILHRAIGIQIGVTWDDLTERWHAADELCPVNETKTLGFTAEPSK